MYFNGPRLQAFVWSAEPELTPRQAPEFHFFHLTSDNYEERAGGGARGQQRVIYAEPGPSVAQGDNYKIGKCNGFNGTDQNKAARDRGPERSLVNSISR